MEGGLWAVRAGFRLHHRYRLIEMFVFRFGNDNYRYRYRLSTFSVSRSNPNVRMRWQKKERGDFWSDGYLLLQYSVRTGK